MTVAQKTARICAILALISGFLIFLPSIIGMDGFNGGFALSTISLMIFLTMLISSLVFAGMAMTEKQIIEGRFLLAHFKYSQDEWQKHMVKDQELAGEEKKYLFYMVAFFFVLFSTIFAIADPEAAPFMIGMAIFFIIFFYIVFRYSVWLNKARNEAYEPEAYISTKGVMIAGQFHCWTQFGGRFESLETSNDYMTFNYSLIVRYGRQSYSVRVPIPKNQKELVDKILKKFTT